MWSDWVACFLLTILFFGTHLYLFPVAAPGLEVPKALSKGSYAIPHQVFQFVIGAPGAASGPIRPYNYSSAMTYIQANCPAALTAYHKAVSIDQKAGLFGCCALFTEGGLFLDEFVELAQPYETSIRADAYGLLLVRAQGQVWQGMMGTAWPGHPFLFCALKAMTAQKERGYLEKCVKGYSYRYELVDRNGRQNVQNETHVTAVSKM